MSRNSANSARKPFCKVCQDAGKSESDYTSHYVKSLPDKRTGICNIICPTLLNTECRFCHEIGHTAKFCTVLAAKKKSEESFVREEQRRTREKPIQQAKPQNNRGGFSVLLDLDDDVKKMPTKKEEFPALAEPSKRIYNIPSYASAVACSNPVPVHIAKQSLPIGFRVLQKGVTIEKTEDKKIISKKNSWADSESDYEEDDTYEEETYADNSAW